MGTVLLPGKFSSIGCKSIADATMSQVTGTPINIPQGVADFPEECRYRVMITDTSPRVFLFEMNAVASFNMMDADLSCEVINAMDVAREVLKMPSMVKDPPLSYTIQGSGPHFCPGGNPGWQFRPGHTALTTNQYVGYLGFVGIRELSMPGVVALHGSMVGGGVAYSLNCTERLGVSNLSVCYGNLSRGAVPGMLLSTNVCELLGMSAAMELYLMDATFSSYACVKAKYITKILPGPAGVKSEGVLTARRMAADPRSWRVPHVKPIAEVQRFATEIIGIALSGKSGALFANLKGKKKSKKATAADEERQRLEDEERQQQELEQQQQLEWERSRRARPKRRPKRRARPPQ